MVEEAKRTSNREVARNYAIAEACIRDWRKNEQKLILSKAQGGQFRKKGGGRPVRDEKLEKILNVFNYSRYQLESFRFQFSLSLKSILIYAL